MQCRKGRREETPLQVQQRVVVSPPTLPKNIIAFRRPTLPSLVLAGGGTGRTCAAGKWCSSPREINREGRIYFIADGTEGSHLPSAVGETKTESQESRELPETPPINSNQFVSFKNKGLARLPASPRPRPRARAGPGGSGGARARVWHPGDPLLLLK